MLVVVILTLSYVSSLCVEERLGSVGGPSAIPP